MDLSKMTPAEIDLLLFPIWIERDKQAFWAANARESAAKCLDPEQHGWRLENADGYYDRAATHDIMKCNAEYAAAPYEAEYSARGGWRRFIFCTNNNGHFHQTEHQCATLYVSTLIAWRPELSGLTDNEMIDAVGHKACTVCFPMAPTTPAWARTLAAEGADKAAEKMAKFDAGLAKRAKKVLNATKRLDKTFEGTTDELQWANHERQWATDDLRYARQELDRWEAKRPLRVAL